MAATSFDLAALRSLPKDPDLRGAKLRDLLGPLFDASPPSCKGDSPLLKAIDSALKTRPKSFSGFIFAIVDALQKAKQGALARSLFAEGRGHWFFRSHTADGELLLRLIPKGGASPAEQHRISSVIDRLRYFHVQDWKLESALEECLPPFPMTEERLFRIWMVRGDAEGYRALVALLLQGELPSEEMGLWEGELTLQDNLRLRKEQPALWEKLAHRYPSIAATLCSSAPLEPALFDLSRRVQRSDLFLLLVRRPLPLKGGDALVQAEWESFCSFGQDQQLRSGHEAWLKSARPNLLSLLARRAPLDEGQLSQIGNLTPKESIALLSKNPAAWRRWIVNHPETANLLFASKEFAIEQGYLLKKLEGGSEEENRVLIPLLPQNGLGFRFLISELRGPIDPEFLTNQLLASLTSLTASEIREWIPLVFGKIDRGDLFRHFSSELTSLLPKVASKNLPPESLLALIEAESTALSLFAKKRPDEAASLLELHTRWLDAILNHPASTAAQKRSSWSSSLHPPLLRDAALTLDLIEAGVLREKGLLPKLNETIHSLFYLPRAKKEVAPLVARLWRAMIQLSDRESIRQLTHSIDFILQDSAWSISDWQEAIRSLIAPLLRDPRFSPLQPSLLLQVIRRLPKRMAAPLLAEAVREAEAAAPSNPSLLLALLDWDSKVNELLGPQERDRLGQFLIRQAMDHLSTELGQPLLQRLLYHFAFGSWIQNQATLEELHRELLSRSLEGPPSIRWQLLGYHLWKKSPVELREEERLLSELKWNSPEEEITSTVALTSDLFSKAAGAILRGDSSWISAALASLDRIELNDATAQSYQREALAYLSHSFLQINPSIDPFQERWNRLVEAPEPWTNQPLLIFSKSLFHHLCKKRLRTSLINAIKRASDLKLYDLYPNLFLDHLQSLLSQGPDSLQTGAEAILTVAPLFPLADRGQLVVMFATGLKKANGDPKLRANALRHIQNPKEIELPLWQRRQAVALLQETSAPVTSSSSRPPARSFPEVDSFRKVQRVGQADLFHSLIQQLESSLPRRTVSPEELSELIDAESIAFHALADQVSKEDYLDLLDSHTTWLKTLNILESSLLCERALNESQLRDNRRTLTILERGAFFDEQTLRTTIDELYPHLLPTSQIRGSELVEAIEQLWRVVVQSANLELIQQLPSAFHLALSSRKWLPSQWTAPIQRTLLLLIRNEKIAPSSTSLLFLSLNQLPDRMAQELLPSLLEEVKSAAKTRPDLSAALFNWPVLIKKHRGQKEREEFGWDLFHLLCDHPHLFPHAFESLFLNSWFDRPEPLHQLLLERSKERSHPLFRWELLGYFLAQEMRGNRVVRSHLLEEEELSYGQMQQNYLSFITKPQESAALSWSAGREREEMSGWAVALITYLLTQASSGKVETIERLSPLLDRWTPEEGEMRSWHQEARVYLFQALIQAKRGQISSEERVQLKDQMIALMREPEACKRSSPPFLVCNLSNLMAGEADPQRLVDLPVEIFKTAHQCGLYRDYPFLLSKHIQELLSSSVLTVDQGEALISQMAELLSPEERGGLLLTQIDQIAKALREGAYDRLIRAIRSPELNLPRWQRELCLLRIGGASSQPSSSSSSGGGHSRS